MSTQAEPRSNVPAIAPVMAIAAGETASSAIAARERAAVEARFLVALHRPRSFDQCRLRLLTACKRPAFAAAARYAKPIGREEITGFSIRFAEEARALWGNLDVSAFLVFDDDERRIYRVIGTDLETNATDGVDVMIEKFVERRNVTSGMEVIGQRANKQGQTVYKVRATEDDLIVKVNAQIAKARRNVILSLIPADVKDECESLCIETSKDADAKDPAAARKQILDAFWQRGVTPEQIAELLGKPLEQINPAEFNLLRQYYTAIKQGEATWQDLVEAHGKKPVSGANGAKGEKGVDALRERLGGKSGKGSPASTQPSVSDSEIEQEDLELSRREEGR